MRLGAKLPPSSMLIALPGHQRNMASALTAAAGHPGLAPGCRRGPGYLWLADLQVGSREGWVAFVRSLQSPVPAD